MKDPARYAANLKWLFTELPFPERFAAAAAEGFTAVEIPDPYSLPAAQLRRLADDAGVRTILVNTPPGPAGSRSAGGAAGVPGSKAEFRAGLERAAEYASTLGATLVHVVAGRRPDGVSRDRAFASYVDNISWAAAQLKDSGLQIVLEMQNQRNAPRFVLESQAMAAAVVEAVGEPVGLLLDLFHLQVQDGDLLTNLSTYLPLTRHIQIGDAPGRTEPGTGELAWHRISSAIDASGYNGWFGCEFQPQGGSAGVLARLLEAR
ncbi:hydroxypyruvate isomerase family protein [Pseudactinotalea terrae]|uniref:hydroxypyruvate isomerase family protein n=1 Tax=Pseudactinotalea terrae TaxID=1743262 RepID=UPI0012E18C16|nr:TIM barrel protein [Pseudactinotalea terrae]